MGAYLENIVKQFAFYKKLGEGTFEQVTDDDLFWQSNEDSNSIATIVKHISGNMLSRWTDFLTTDGEKAFRKRDEEFLNDLSSREEMLLCWEKGWQCLFKAMEDTAGHDLDKLVYIRNQGHTIAEAINRQLAHYAYHIGQIVYIGKLKSSNNWRSLSIPRGNSDKYNKEKFDKKKHKAHFTNEFLKNNDK